MTVSELRHRMTSVEYQDWMRYFEHRPAEWEQSERIEVMLARMHAGFVKNGDPNDFMLLSKRQREEINRKDFERELMNLKFTDDADNE